MREITAVVRLKLGVCPDNTNLSAEDVLGLINVIPVGQMDVEPFSVEFKDMDSGLIVAETIYEERHPHE